MRKLLLGFIFLLVLGLGFSPASSVLRVPTLTDGDAISDIQEAEAAVRVKGYYRKDGTYVKPHYRSNPDGNPYNNWSFPGNVNPYTGKVAPGNPDTYLKNYNKSGSSGLSGSSNVSLKSPSISIPTNAHAVGSFWECDTGYVKKDSKCISYTEDCTNRFGENVYGKKSSENNNSSCYCKTGFEWSKSIKACVKKISIPTNAHAVDSSWECNVGYVKRDNKCISYTEDCMNHFGVNGYGSQLPGIAVICK